MNLVQKIYLGAQNSLSINVEKELMPSASPPSKHVAAMPSFPFDSLLLARLPLTKRKTSLTTLRTDVKEVPNTSITRINRKRKLGFSNKLSILPQFAHYTIE